MCAFTKQMNGMINPVCHVFYAITRIGVGTVDIRNFFYVLYVKYCNKTFL